MHSRIFRFSLETVPSLGTEPTFEGRRRNRVAGGLFVDVVINTEQQQL
jgi:hypothetical protein